MILKSLEAGGNEPFQGYKNCFFWEAETFWENRGLSNVLRTLSPSEDLVLFFFVPVPIWLLVQIWFLDCHFTLWIRHLVAMVKVGKGASLSLIDGRIIQSLPRKCFGIDVTACKRWSLIHKLGHYQSLKGLNHPRRNGFIPLPAAMHKSVLRLKGSLQIGEKSQGALSFLLLFPSKEYLTFWDL